MSSAKGPTRSRRASPTGACAVAAGFPQATREDLEELARSDLRGVVSAPRLLTAEGLWVTFQGREPCCGARLLLNVRATDLLGDGRLDELFREAERSRDVRHPSVLFVRRFGRTERLLWITTRSYRGRLLRRPRTSKRVALQSRALGFLSQVAGPLEGMHRAGFVHGALSSSSFHRDMEGRVRLRNVGFDVPVLQSCLHAHVGTEAAACASPEVRDGGIPGSKSDQYALAALIVRTLTGRYPAPHGARPLEGVPESMRSALRRALHVDPEARFPSVSAMWHALDPEDGGASAPVGGGGQTSRRRMVSPAGAGAVAHSNTEISVDDVPPTAPPREEASRTASTPERRAGRGRRRNGRSEVIGRVLATTTVLTLFVACLELFGPDGTLSLSALPGGDTVAARFEGVLSSLHGLHGMGRAGASASGIAEIPESEEEVVPDHERSPNDGGAAPALGLAPRSPADPAFLGTDRTSIDVDPPSAPVDPAPETGESPAVVERTGALRGAFPDEDTAATPALLPGSFSIHTFPWGSVYLDGHFVGNSPVVDMRVTAGRHTIRVERDGYEPYEATVTVESGRVLRLTGITLRNHGT